MLLAKWCADFTQVLKMFNGMDNWHGGGTKKGNKTKSKTRIRLHGQSQMVEQGSRYLSVAPVNDFIFGLLTPLI